MRALSFISGAAVGAAAVWFLDPESGTRRRSIAQDKAGKYARKGAAEAGGAARSAGAQAKGAAMSASPAGSSRNADDLNDAGLKAKVESEIFREADAPKDKVSVDVADGVVTLRGELGAEDEASRLEQDASSVDGVREVRNLLSTSA
jgi:osmotically-inducible protein OsmY